MCVESQQLLIRDRVSKCGDAVPDVVILDLNLIDSDGVETLEAVKGMVDDRVAIVVFSGHKVWETECMRLGADEFILKGDASSKDIDTAVIRAAGRRRLTLAIDNEPKEITFSGGGYLDTGKIGDGLLDMAAELRAMAAAGG